MSIANYFTFIRLFIGPLFFWIYSEHDNLQISLTVLPYLLLLLLGIAELSDAIDGYIARKLNQVTDLGKILDPMADSIYRISVFLTFTMPPINIPIGLVFIILYRDSIISTLRTVCALNGMALAARTSGKLKAIIQGVAALLIVLLLIPFSLNDLSLESLQFTSAWIASIAAIYTLLSGIDYLVAHWSYIQTSLSPRKNHN